MKDLRSWFLLLLVSLVTWSCNKKQEAERKLGIANSSYKLILLISSNTVKDSFGFHQEYDSAIVNQSVSLQIDSSAKKALYNGVDNFYSSDNSLNNYYCTKSNDPKIARQELKLKNDSIFVGQTIMTGNISHGRTYIGHKMP